MATLAESSPGRLVALPRRRRGNGAWLVILILAVVAAAAVGYLVLELVRTRGALAGAREEAQAARGRVVAAERRVALAESARQTDRNDHVRDMAAVRAELAQTSDKAKEADLLASKLSATVKASEGAVKRDGERLTLELVDKVLFRSAQAELTPQGVKMLQAVGKILREFPDKQVWVQGHTDDVPIATPAFRSNWELSTARALNVVHFLQDRAKVEPRRLAAVGFSQFRPVSKARAKNRRIEIVLFPQKVTVR